MEQATSSLGLIERVKSGDHEAFSILFNTYQRRLAVLIHYKLSVELRRFTEVEDILQETMLEAYRDIEQFNYQRPGSFLNWLSRIADHVIADLARYQGRRRRHAAEIVRLKSDSNPDGPEPVNTKTPSRILADEEGVLSLIEKLNQLPDDYRQAILLAKIEGLSTQEMAERFGKTREATSLILHRAIKRFRALQ